MKGFARHVETMIRCGRDLWLRGFAERNAGNLSLRLDRSALPSGEAAGPWRDLPAPVREVAGDAFLMTATGSLLRVADTDPARHLCLIEIDGEGRRYRPRWGHGRPTSELLPHLRAHAARRRGRGPRDRAVLHTHPPRLIALTYARPLTSASLTRLLWEMHTECVVVFPEGVGFVPWRLPGSGDLAEATASVLERRPLAVWQHHGVVAAGPDLEAAFGLVETAEKAAEIHGAAVSLGGVVSRLSADTLRLLARAFDVEPDEEILGGGS